MLTFISTSPQGDFAQTVKTQAIAGAVAGVALGVIHGVISVRYSQLRDRYDVLGEGLTHAGTGAILGVLGGASAAFAGVSVAPIAGRGAVAIAAPLVASAVVTSSAHKPVERLVRSWSRSVVSGLRRISGRSQASSPRRVEGLE